MPHCMIAQCSINPYKATKHCLLKYIKFTIQEHKFMQLSYKFMYINFLWRERSWCAHFFIQQIYLQSVHSFCEKDVEKMSLCNCYYLFRNISSTDIIIVDCRSGYFLYRFQTNKNLYKISATNIVHTKNITFFRSVPIF